MKFSDILTKYIIQDKNLRKEEYYSSDFEETYDDYSYDDPSLAVVFLGDKDYDQTEPHETHIVLYEEKTKVKPNIILCD